MSPVRHPAVVALVAAAPQADAETRALARVSAEALVARVGGVLLATCHRVELYLPDGAATRAALSETRHDGLVALDGPPAARRLVEVALGLHSAVLAEDQLIHQLRAAVADARHRGPLGRDLERLMDAALRAGRIARSWRPAARGKARSLADVALERIGATSGGGRGRVLLVVGTGVMGRAVASAAVRDGMAVRVASRTDDHARAEAVRVGGIPWPIDPGADLAAVDAIVVALAGPWRLGPEGTAAIGACPAVVDLSMPPALAPGLRARLGPRLTDIDALATVAPDPAGADAAMIRYRERLEDLAQETLGAYLEDLEARRVSGADRLMARVERQRVAALEAYLRHRPDVSPELRRHLEDVTRDVSCRIVQEPLRRLAEDPDGRRGRALDEIFGV